MHDSDHRFSELSQYATSDKYSEREKVALTYCDAIVWDPSSTDDALWERLHANFTEPEIVEIGFWCGFTSGGQRFLHTLHTKQGELNAAIEADKIGSAE